VRRKIIRDYNLAVVREERIFLCGFAKAQELFFSVFLRRRPQRVSLSAFLPGTAKRRACFTHNMYVKRRNIIARSLAAATKA
jgi:hypothetical protein